MAETDDLQWDLQVLETQLRKLEAEYNMYFAGQLAKPPNEARAHVHQLVQRHDRAAFDTYASRFRFSVLQARYATLADLWERALRAREEGRPGPFSGPRAGAGVRAAAPDDRVLHVAIVADPAAEIDKVRALHKRLVEAQTQVGREPVPFDQFLGLVEQHIRRLRAGGSPEAAFRVAFAGGRVSFMARALRKTARKDRKERMEERTGARPGGPSATRRG
jgi:hypothetical protein